MMALPPSAALATVWSSRAFRKTIVAVAMAALMMVVPGVVGGASFNCTNARTSAEKAICASPALSSLDEQLAKAYASAIAVSDNPDVVKRQQHEWLRNIRDKCVDETCLKSAYEHRLAQLAAAKQAGWKTFRDTTLGLEFSYPSTRHVKVGCRSSKNCIALTGTPMPHSEYLIAFEVFDGDLEKVAAEEAVFAKRDSGWIARGRFGEHPVVSLVGPGWRGLTSTVDCGISDTRGFHAAAGECMWAVLSNGRRSVVVDTQGIVGADEASMRTVQSLRFLK
jgi:uncharacterized protein